MTYKSTISSNQEKQSEKAEPNEEEEEEEKSARQQTTHSFVYTIIPSQSKSPRKYRATQCAQKAANVHSNNMLA